MELQEEAVVGVRKQVDFVLAPPLCCVSKHSLDKSSPCTLLCLEEDRRGDRTRPRGGASAPRPVLICKRRTT